MHIAMKMLVMFMLVLVLLVCATKCTVYNVVPNDDYYYPVINVIAYSTINSTAPSISPQIFNWFSFQEYITFTLILS